MPLDDDDPDKWILQEHTKVKHRILQKYLVPWTRILSSGNPRIHYFDGFAGRGRYEDGEPGSPLLAMDVANRLSDGFEEFLCTFVEKNPNNYEDLVDAVEEKSEECGDNIEIIHRDSEFEEVIEEIIEELDGNEILPSFFFIDPFGYNAMPFEIVSDILNLRDTGVELFLTFMVRDIRRFLSSPGHEDSITRILGTEEWKEIPESHDNKEEEILKIYERQLKTVAGAKYVWPFEMKMPERKETVYYLIHVTNHFKGHKIMKHVMYKEGAKDQFAYLGPDHYAYDSGQQTLFESSNTEDTRISDLADFLFERFEGQRLTFWEVMKKSYTETNYIEEHYRKAIKHLADEHRVTIHRFPERTNGTKERGVGHDDEITFERQYQDLTSFC